MRNLKHSLLSVAASVVFLAATLAIKPTSWFLLYQPQKPE